MWTLTAVLIKGPWYLINQSLGGGNSNIFYVHPKNWGRWTHFDEHIFFQLAGLKPPPRIRSVWKTQVDHYIPLLTQWLRCLTSFFKCLSPSIDGCSQGFLISWSSSAKMCHIRTCETGRGSNWRPNTDVAWRESSDVRKVCMLMWQVEKYGGSGPSFSFKVLLMLLPMCLSCFLVVTVSWYSRFLKVLGCCFLLLLPLSLSRSLFYRRSTRWFECAILTAMARQFSVAMRNHEKPSYSILLNAGFLIHFPFEGFPGLWFRTMIEWFPLSSRKLRCSSRKLRCSSRKLRFLSICPDGVVGGRTVTIHFGVISGRILDWWFSLIVYFWRCGEVISCPVQIVWSLFLCHLHISDFNR